MKDLTSWTTEALNSTVDAICDMADPVESMLELLDECVEELKSRGEWAKPAPFKVKWTGEDNRWANVDFEDGRQFAICDHGDNPWVPRDKPVVLMYCPDYMGAARETHKAWCETVWMERYGAERNPSTGDIFLRVATTEAALRILEDFGSES